MTNPTTTYTGLRPVPSQRSLDTHTVDNVAPGVPDQNLYLSDEALRGVCEREGIE